MHEEIARDTPDAVEGLVGGEGELGDVGAVLDPGPGNRCGGAVASSQGVGATVVLAGLFWDQSMNTRPVRWLLALTAVAASGVSRASRWASFWRRPTVPARVAGRDCCVELHFSPD